MTALRILGYWLLYATVGAVILLMLVAGAGDVGSEDSKSPTRTRTKVVGALSGAALLVVALGAYLRGDPSARAEAALLVFVVGVVLAVVFTAWAWLWLARDLGRRRRRA
jgi:hypothetical protein